MKMLDFTSSKIITLFTRQLSAMLGAGLPLVKSLETLIEQTEQPTWKYKLQKITEDVRSGSSFQEALKKDTSFSTLYQSMVGVGEASGSLDTILDKLALYLEKQEKIKRKILSALTYPVIIMLVSIIVITLLLVFVIPNFTEMFSSMGKELPNATKTVIKVSAFISTNLIFILLSGIATLVLIAYLYRKDEARLYFDKFFIGLPVIGTLIKKSAISRFASTLGTLLKSGVTLIEAMRITAATSGNKVVELAVLKSLQNITAGKEIAEPLKETGIFPPMVTQMVSVGENSGQLPEMLIKVAEFYDSEVDSAVDSMTSIIEPVMMFFLAIVVAGLLIAMYLPMFDMIENIQ